jgi:aminopeptidase N
LEEKKSTENWGLITFRETAMLYEPGVSAIGKKITVAAVISHEIAHQVCWRDKDDIT